MEAAQKAHMTGRYAVSCDTFCHLLALLELGGSGAPDETHAMILSNIGSALHFMGELVLATEYYEKAVDEFGAIQTGWVAWLQAGNVNERRVAYIRSRLLQITTGERADPAVYLDGNGKMQRFTQEEMDGTDKLWSIFHPRTWWYGGYVPPGYELPSRDPPAASI